MKNDVKNKSSFKKPTSSYAKSHKKTEKKINKREIKEIKTLSEKLNPSGCVFVGTHLFSCGQKVPIFEIQTVHALNQVIGYAKFINRSSFDVYYRGECKLHDTVLPSLFRGKANCNHSSQRINTLIKKISDDDKMKHQLKLNNEEATNSTYVIEGMLQHYGVKTRFIDVVDNHWVALWMGLYKNKSYRQILDYNHYIKRSIPLVDFANGGKSCTDEELYQYILLVAVPKKWKQSIEGLYIADDIIKIDLRKTLPSIFLRPHAQHGFVIRKKPKDSNFVSNFDFANNVIGVLKMRIDYVDEWIGTGNLLSQDNLFPAPAYDQGYDILLSRTDLFAEKDFEIARYI